MTSVGRQPQGYDAPYSNADARSGNSFRWSDSSPDVIQLVATPHRSLPAVAAQSGHGDHAEFRVEAQTASRLREDDRQSISAAP